MSSYSSSAPNCDTICDVWSYNLNEEFKKISLLAKHYNYVALDTEFPGVVCRPFGQYLNPKNFHYQEVKSNVDILKVIQIGLTLLDSRGRMPSTGATTWQFNFRFDLTEDMFAEESIELLSNSGVQFERLAIDGIDRHLFAELLTASGLVLTSECKWISFHGGYDFAYLLRLLTDENLPSDLLSFNDLLKVYFPVFYDIKYLMNTLNGYTGSLEDIATKLELRRFGRPHQAGSDSFVSGNAFFQLSYHCFNGNLNQKRYIGQLYQLNAN